MNALDRAHVMIKADDLAKLVAYQQEVKAIERVIQQLLERKSELLQKFEELSQTTFKTTLGEDANG